MKTKLKAAISAHGRLFFLEKFPDDEEHVGLHHLLLATELEVMDNRFEPGIYEATVSTDLDTMSENEEVYLVIEDLVKV